MHTGGVEMLTVVDETGRDRLIPMASDIVVKIDQSRS
jgi:ribosomal 30S subunit maturation factor RimM